MPQLTFTYNEKDAQLVKDIDYLSDKDGRSRSGMIVLLLQQAVKERLRKRNAKINIKHYPSNLGESNGE